MEHSYAETSVSHSASRQEKVQPLKGFGNRELFMSEGACAEPLAPNLCPVEVTMPVKFGSRLCVWPRRIDQFEEYVRIVPLILDHT